MTQIVVEMQVDLVEVDQLTSEVFVSSAAQEITPTTATPIELTVEPQPVQVGIEETTVRVELSAGPRGRDGLPGVSAMVLEKHVFISSAERDAYFAAHPEELSDGVMVAVTGELHGDTMTIFPHATSHVILAEEMNACHSFSTPNSVATLPPAVVPGRWCRLKNNSAGPLVVLANGQDSLAGNSQMSNDGVEPYGFIDFVVEAAGLYGVHATRGLWEGT